MGKSLVILKRGNLFKETLFFNITMQWVSEIRMSKIWMAPAQISDTFCVWIMGDWKPDASLDRFYHKQIFL